MLEAHAFKRSASCFGLGRYFYNLSEMWVPLDEHRWPIEYPMFPGWAFQKSAGDSDRGESAPSAVQFNMGLSIRGSRPRSTDSRTVSGIRFLGEILWRVARARKANAIPNAQLQSRVAEVMERASLGLTEGALDLSIDR
jgi:hypothetical protein